MKLLRKICMGTDTITLEVENQVYTVTRKDINDKVIYFETDLTRECYVEFGLLEYNEFKIEASFQKALDLRPEYV
jgi:hypothetical protein